jgi:hypothetical protein
MPTAAGREARYDNGLDESAEAWIMALGEAGDWARQNVLDPALLERIAQRRYRRAALTGAGRSAVSCYDFGGSLGDVSGLWRGA